MRTIGHLIDGKPTESHSGRTQPVFDPATGAITSEVSLADVAEVDAAVAAARQALTGWAATSLGARANVLFTLRHLIDTRRDEIAAAITSEHGKVLSDAGGEVARALENVEFACGIPQLLKGGFSDQVATDVDVYEIRQPVGVVAAITPFNFPFMVPVWMVANAIACGNAVVLKPSEKDPSAAMLLAELCLEAGLPPGVLNVLNGDKVAVDRLLTHPDIAAISFVGSTPIARYIYETGAAHGKRVQALGGAKNHMVVMPDADVTLAADAAVNGAYGSAGERCMAVSVVVTVGAVADTLVGEIASRAAALTTGAGNDASSEMGPLITQAHRDKVESYVHQAESDGASIVVDGRTLRKDEGFFLGPCLVDHVTPEMSVYADEVFGPVLSVVRAESLDEAIALINANAFGNGTAIFTADGAAARRFTREVNVGMVGVNVPIPVPVAYYSFGGWKASLFGDTHMYGPEGVKFFTRTKAVTQRWRDDGTRGTNLNFPTNR